MFECPRCASKLSTQVVEGVEIETCPSCGGIWLDADELKELASKEVQSSHEIAPTAFSPHDAEGDMRCPKCQKIKLDAFIYAFDSGIELDRCPQCQGVWLDKNELDQVAALMGKNQESVAKDLERFSNVSSSSGLARYSGFLTWLGRTLMKDRYGHFSWSD